MALIPQPFIDDLLARVDIVELIGSRLHLKKAGSNFLALCPFHNEKTPSFTVSPAKQFFHCFGCGAHGSAIGFIMQFEHLEFVEAIEKLATQLGLEIPKTSSSSANQVSFTPLYELLEKITRLYQKYLTRNPQAEEYLKKRGISPKMHDYFKIGYAPKSWDYLQSIIDKKPALQQLLITTGMLGKKDNRTYANFRDRIMFPISDRRGHIIGFGGRTLGDDLPKYLNSPETPLFHKGNELYGLYEAKKAANLKQLLVVEGYMDVVALVQYNITNVVATLGTAITSKQIQQLLHYCNDIIFCFDGDAAGKKAGWRALENSLPLIHDGIQIKFLFIPDNEDPDSLIRKEGTDAFNRRLEQAMPLSEFILKELASKTNAKTIDGRASLAKEAKLLLQQMNNSLFKRLLIEKLAATVQTSTKTFEQTNTATVRSVKSRTTMSLTPIQSAINIILHYPSLSEHIQNVEDLATIALPDIDLLIQLITLTKKTANLTLGAILEYWRDHKDLEKIAVLSTKEPLLSADDLKPELISIIQKLHDHAKDQVIKALMGKAAVTELTNEEKQQLQKLISTQKEILNSKF